MEERRLLLAVALSLVVLTAYSLLFSPSSAPEKTPASSPASSVPVAPTTTPGAATAPPVLPVAAAVAEAPAGGARTVADERERRVEVATPDGVVAFTNRGARLVSWKLLHHLDANGRPEEMIPAEAAGVRPLDLETGDPTVDAKLREALFLPSAEAVAVHGPEGAELRFSWADGEGLEAEKTLRFPGRGGLVAVTASIRRRGETLPSQLVWGPGLGNETPEERDVRGYQPPGAVILGPAGVARLVPGKLPGTGQSFEGVRWAGIESHYFAALFVTPTGSGRASVRPVGLPTAAGEKPITTVVVDVDASGAGPLLLFVGAKDYNVMARLGHELQQVVPVGDWIGPIVVPLMGLLRWVQGHVGNWGWAIVLLTLLINVAMAPFRHYSIVNGLKMAKISPEMKVIQERYRKVPLMDPRRQQMQEEIGALYAKHGMSMGSQMAVGCLPLLLTMPFLFAFYRVLTVLVELRGAHFLWVPDLAAKDPLYVMPIVMGLSMFVMQKMTPTAMDPAQQRVMMLMPLMLAGMFLWAPAGLNLYWLTSNLWSVGQQAVEMKLLKPADARSRGRRTK